MLQGLKKLRDAVNREDANTVSSKPVSLCFNVIGLMIFLTVTVAAVFHHSTFLLLLALVAGVALDRLHPMWQWASAYGSVTLRVLARASKRALFAWRDPSSLWGADTVAEKWAALLKRMENPEDMLKFHASDANIGLINRRRLAHFGYELRYTASGFHMHRLEHTVAESWDWGFAGDFDAMIFASIGLVDALLFMVILLSVVGILSSIPRYSFEPVLSVLWVGMFAPSTTIFAICFALAWHRVALFILAHIECESEVNAAVAQPSTSAVTTASECKVESVQ